MGIADMFGKDDRFEIKTEAFIGMVQEAAAAEARVSLLGNAINCNVPYRYIREMITGKAEEVGTDTNSEENNETEIEEGQE